MAAPHCNDPRGDLFHFSYMRKFSEPETPSFKAWNTEFQSPEHRVSKPGTPSFKAWNTQFQGLKLSCVCNLKWYMLLADGLRESGLVIFPCSRNNFVCAMLRYGSSEVGRKAILVDGSFQA